MKSNLFVAVRSGLTKHSTEILIGLGVAGLLGTTILAVRETPKALKLLENKKKELDVEKLSVKDTVKTVWKNYIPCAVLAVTSVACIVGASNISARRNAALAAAYAIGNKAFSDYKEEVINLLGEEKDKEIKEKVADKLLKENPVTNKEVIITDNNEHLCYDEITGRYFKSSQNKIKEAQNVINDRLRDEMWVSLNDLYYELCLPNVRVGDDLGWNIDDGYLDIILSSRIAEDGTPCLTLDYSIGPRYDYR
jgi:hypothetical protein|nr:MAG TPA: hypothetical protein [Caudoviricetes sp.]